MMIDFVEARAGGLGCKEYPACQTDFSHAERGADGQTSKRPGKARLDIVYSKPGGLSTSKSHGGFDNDVATLTSIMSRILGKKPALPPKADEVTGY